jgi:hypothetical protein
MPHDASYQTRIAHETGRIRRSPPPHGRRAARWALALVLFPIVTVGCAPTEAGAVLAPRLRECGLLSSGTIGPYTLSGIYAPNACYEGCLAEASCEALEDGLCRTMLDLLVACDERCAFRCDDGGLLGPERLCDGAMQCMGGEDEEGCAFDLVCTDGSRVPGARCDGGWNCPDGSDEAGCPPSSGYFECTDRSGTLYTWQRCDGTPSCSDGSDETGCPSWICESGQRLTYREREASPRCNGYPQCTDASDERNCAALTVRCGS